MEYVFKKEIENYQVNELLKRLPFLVEDDINYVINYRGDLAYSLSISSITTSQADELFHMLDVLLDDICKLKNIPGKAIWEKPYLSSKSNIGEIFSNGFAYKNSLGQITLTGDLLKLYNNLNALFGTISQQLFCCEEYHFPVLLTTQTLEATGYFEHNPYQWLKVNRLKRGIHNYLLYSQKNVVQTSECPETSDFGYSLPPTMCYYVYDMLKNTSINNSAYTTSGRSFRYEGDCDKPFERLVDFTIRETVFVGTKEYVEESVERYMYYTVQVMDMLGTSGRCETANDIFFMTDRTAERLNVQKMLGSKYELLLYIPDGKLMAVASFNKHGNFIGKRFGIRSKNEGNRTAYSACVGIGLERLLYACVTQLGLDNITKLNLELENPRVLIKKLTDGTSME